MPPNAQRGFTLIETLIAIAIGVIVIAVLTAAVQWALQWGRTIATRQTEHAQFEALLDRLHADEDTAWAIFAPSVDVLGQANTDGHEVDFFTRDGHDRPYFWAYRYDKSAKTITKYVYSRPGTTAILDPASAVNNVASFKATTYTIDKLAETTSAIYNPLFAGKTLTPVAIHYGYGSEVAGGNQITAVNFTGTSIAESVQLATQTAPSGWTVRFHYTKSAVAALSVWPKYVIYGANGANVVRRNAEPPVSVASVLNVLLGGAAADALTTCKARAFTDANFSIPDATVTTHDPTSGDATTGCYDGHIEVFEPGYNGVFNTFNISCGPSIQIGAWSANSGGSSRAAAGATSVSAICQIAATSADQTSTTDPNHIVTAQAIAGGGCSRIGEECTGTANWPPDMNPQCDVSGGIIQGGWTGSGRFVVTPMGMGTFTSVDGANWLFERTALGPVKIAAEAVNISWTTVNGICKSKTTFSPVSTWMLN